MTKNELYKKITGKNGRIEHYLEMKKSYITYQHTNLNKTREILEAMKKYLNYDKNADVNGGRAVGGYVAGGYVSSSIFYKLANEIELNL